MRYRVPFSVSSPNTDSHRRRNVGWEILTKGAGLSEFYAQEYAVGNVRRFPSAGRLLKLAVGVLSAMPTVCSCCVRMARRWQLCTHGYNTYVRLCRPLWLRPQRKHIGPTS